MFLILSELSSFYAKYTERKRTLVSLRSGIRAYTEQYESKLGNKSWWSEPEHPSSGWCSWSDVTRCSGWTPTEGTNPALRPQAYYKGYDNIADSDGPLVLPPLPIGHTFVVTSSLMQMLTTRGLFSALPSEDPHAHIAKVRAVCKSCVGRPDLDLDVIGLRVFPFSLTGEAAIWFTECPYNSIFTWN